MDENQEGYSMPLSAPAYTAPPYYGTAEGKFLAIPFVCENEDALRYEIPYPLELGPDRLALGWIGDFSQPNLSLDLYHEAGIGVQVKYKEKIGWYFPYLWASKDNAVVLFREVYGWPYMLCDDDRLRIDGNQILALCRRRDEILVRASLNVTSPPPSRRQQPLEQEFSKLMADGWIQIRKLPPPDKDGQPLRQLLSIEPENIRIHEIWGCDAFLELAGSGYYPNLHRLHPKKFLQAYYIRMEWILPYPKVLWEKLRSK